MRASVIGNSLHIILALPNLLTQAGFEVDCLSTQRILKSMASLRHFLPVTQFKRMPEMAAVVMRN